MKCPICKQGEKVREAKVSIPIGKMSFRTTTLQCKTCGHYAVTPKIRREMDSWARALKKNVIEPQPLFTEAAHVILEETASRFGIKKVPLIKLMTGFYLNHIIRSDDFDRLMQVVKKQEIYALMTQGRKLKISVPIHFLTFKKLELFRVTWNISHAKVIEEAVLFCNTVLTYHDTKRLREIARRIKEFVEDSALAA